MTTHRHPAWPEHRGLLVAAGTGLVMVLAGVHLLLPPAVFRIALTAATVTVSVAVAFQVAARQRAEEEQARLATVVEHEHVRERWLEDELTWHTEHDATTGVRAGSWFAEAVGTAARHGGPATVLRVSIDGLLAMADIHGQAAATDALHTVAQRIRAACAGPWSAEIGRVGPGELGVLLHNEAPHGVAPRDVERIARDVLGAVRTPVTIATGVVHLTATIGWARQDDDASGDGTVLLHQASTALHAAQQRGVEHVEAFDAQVHAEVADRLTLAADLRTAVVTQAFELEFQPIVDLEDGRVVEAEALVRWNHPERGRIDPGRFIPDAERGGHMHHIGRFVLEEAAWQAREWQRQYGSRAPTVAINVSARQLDERLADVVEEVLDDTMLTPSSLTLELTETALAPGGSDQLLRRLHDLKDLGVNLALDDFGTGYSSLAYLEQLPFDVLKIDRAFVTGSAGRPSVTSAIIDLARAMQLVTVIEGIETPEQRDRFRALGCDRGQGFLFGVPTTAAEVLRGGLSTVA